MLEILHKHNPLERIRGLDNCDVRVFFCEGFSLGHVITTMIINLGLKVSTNRSFTSLSYGLRFAGPHIVVIDIVAC